MLNCFEGEDLSKHITTEETKLKEGYDLVCKVNAATGAGVMEGVESLMSYILS